MKCDGFRSGNATDGGACCHSHANLSASVPIGLALLFALLAGSLGAQSPCPTVNFLLAKSVGLKPSPKSHTFVVQQNDRSFIGYELADSPPRGIIRTTPHMEKQFADCLSHNIPDAPIFSATNSLQFTSQLQAVAALRNGNYVVAHSDGSGSQSVYFDLFDSQLHFVSQSGFSFKPGSPGVIDHFSQFLYTDLNGDGELDVVAVVRGSTLALYSGAIMIFLGNGDGTFQAPSRYGLPAYGSNSVAVGDLNGDGKPDLAIATSGFVRGEGHITILRNIGEGKFSYDGNAFANLDYPGSVALADLNGDGNLDLVFSNATGPRVVDIALGNGDGTFGPLAEFPVNGDSLAVGDVNGDGIPDIVTDGISILFGDGKGGISNRKDFKGGQAYDFGSMVMLTDFDGDGEVDIVIGTGNPKFFVGNGLTVVFGKGGGNFETAPVTNINGDCPPYCGAVSMAASDLNLDGIPDLIYVHQSDSRYPGALTVLQGKGDGTFFPVFQHDFQYDQSNPDQITATSVVSADFDNDGKPDVAVAIGHVPGSSEVHVFIGGGDGTLRPTSILRVPAQYIQSISAADFNSDGNIDIVVLTRTGDPTRLAENAIWVYMGKGDGTFSSPFSNAAGSRPNSLAIGDFNNDGKLDLAIANSAVTLQTANVALLLGKGDGTFASGASIPLSAPSINSNTFVFGPMQLISADFNGDGQLDLAARLGSTGGDDGGFAILVGNGDGTFQTPILRPGRFRNMLAADFNGDGILDLAGGSAIFIGNGDGTFQAALEIPSADIHVVADFNGDGMIDFGEIFGSGVAAVLNLNPPTLTVPILERSRPRR